MTVDQLGHDGVGGRTGADQPSARPRARRRGESRSVPPPRLAAPVKGFAAWALVLLVDRHGPDQMHALQRLAARDRLDPAYLIELRSSWAAIREAAEQWLEWERQSRPSVDGIFPRPGTEAPSSSSQAPSLEIDTTTAANMLDVSTSRVRQIMRAGKITGRKVGRVWLVSAASVKAYREVR
jgi:excisionase family DNA binding protein